MFPFFSRSILKNSSSPSPVNRTPTPRPVPVSPTPVKRAVNSPINVGPNKVNVQVSQWNGNQPSSPTAPS